MTTQRLVQKWRRQTAATILALAMVACSGRSDLLGRAAADAQTVDGQLRIVRTISQSGLTQVAWSADGRYIAASISGNNPSYIVWDALSGRKVSELGRPFGSYFGGPNLQFAPDGKHLLVQFRDFDRDDPNLVMFSLWNVETGTIDGSIKGWPGVDNYAVSVEGQRLAVLYREDVVFLYDTRTWAQIATFPLDRDTPVAGTAFAISRDGKLIAGGGQDPNFYRGDPLGRIVVFDAETGKLVRRIVDTHQDGTDRIAFVSPDLVVSTARQDGQGGPDQGAVRIWNIGTGKQTASFAAEITSPEAVIATPDGRYVVLAAQGQELRGGVPSALRLWDAQSGQQVGAISEKGTYFGRLVLSPDGRQLAAIHLKIGSAGGAYELAIVAIGAPR